MANLALGFALIPDKEGTLYVCELNRRINHVYPSEFILREKGTLLPHVSLFQGQFSEQRLEEIYRAVGKLHQDYRSLQPVETAGINVWATKIFFLDLSKEQLQRMHEDVFYALNGLREQSAGSADPQAFVGITPEEAHSFRTYGYPFALNAFRPHFTVGRSETPDGKEQDFARQLELEKPPPEKITFDKLIVFDVGKYGRLEGIRKEYQLFA